MAWWTRLFRRESEPSPDGQYRVTCVLYSEDGKRAAEVREVISGRAYLHESEQVAGGHFVERHEGKLVGPFDSPSHAERFVTRTPWFIGDASAFAK